MTFKPDTLVNHLNQALLITNTAGKIVFMSPSAEALFAISRRKAHQLDLAALPTGNDKLFGTYLQKTLNSGQTITHRELVINLPEQKRSITVDCTLSVLEQEQRYIMIELASLDRIMRIAREEQLMMQQQASREVVRGMAHEIKNPLGGIRGAAQLLEREVNASQQELTQIIISEVDRLQSLVDRMLGPRKPPQKESINIHEVLAHVIKLVQVETEGQLAFKHEYDPSLPPIMADRDQIIQSVLNIVRNAWEAMSNQTKAAQITLKTQAQRSFTIGNQHHRLVLALHIIDNGPGIPKDLIEHIFYPMVTGRSEGTGLGLPIAQSLIHQHQGLIECESEPGRTCFSLYLPISTKKANK